MADEKQKSNIIRPKDKYIPDEQYGDWEKWRKARTIRAEGTSLGAAAETALSTQKLPAVYEAMLKKMWLAKQNEDKSDKLQKVNLVTVAKFTDSAMKQIGLVMANDKKQNEEDKSDRIKKANPVMVTDYSEDALKKAGLGKWSLKDEDDDKKESPQKREDWLANLIKSVIPLLLIGGAAWAMFNQMRSGGPFQGIANVLTKAILKVGKFFTIGKIGETVGKGFLSKVSSSVSNFFTKIIKPIEKFIPSWLGKIGKVTGSILKKFPIIATGISWASAWTRFKDGDILGGVIDSLAGIAYLVPGKGTAIGMGLDGFSIYRDLSGDDTFLDKFLSKIKGESGYDPTPTPMGTRVGYGDEWTGDVIEDYIKPKGLLNNNQPNPFNDMEAWKNTDKSIKRVERSLENNRIEDSLNKINESLRQDRFQKFLDDMRETYREIMQSQSSGVTAINSNSNQQVIHFNHQSGGVISQRNNNKFIGPRLQLAY